MSKKNIGTPIYSAPEVGDFDGGLMSSVEGKRLKRTKQIKVPCITMEKLLNNHGIQNIDFFSLDVEGYELNVLKSINFNIHRPKYMLIEIYSEDYADIFLRALNPEREKRDIDSLKKISLEMLARG